MNVLRAASKAARQTNTRARFIYEDKGIIVVDKPTGLICQSTKNAPSDFDGLLNDARRKLELDEKPLQVHRLDKFTTGTLVLAKSAASARAIAQQFRKHTIKKTYLAIVRGGKKTFPVPGKGTINAALRVDPDRVVIDESNGRPALTDWELLGSSEEVPLSLIRMALHSGIKHQLRIHLANVLQAPILGDTVYSNKAPAPEILKHIPPGILVSAKRASPADLEKNPECPVKDGEARVFLHAARIKMTRFRSAGPHKRLTVGVVAPLPKDFVSICRSTGLIQFLPPQYIEGGLEVDGKPVPVDKEIEGIKGRWIA